MPTSCPPARAPQPPELLCGCPSLHDHQCPLSSWLCFCQVPPLSIPVQADVRSYNWQPLIQASCFDVIMMDPPWQLATSNPTRGVALGYNQLTNQDILNLPVPQLQHHGYLFVWVINASFRFALQLFAQWGYTLVDEIAWVKLTVNRRMAKSHGYYLQHAKEVCLVARKDGPTAPGTRCGLRNDLICSQRRGQSQKPEEIYELIEDLVPNGCYLEVFGRQNNLRNYWVTVGNEVSGSTTSPAEFKTRLGELRAQRPGTCPIAANQQSL
eukprot:jgi/Astpho2/2643/e_gw1.00049.31.1_t